MEKLSKTFQLGLIILALRLIGNLKFPVPRIISALARLLGVSRKAGYAAARRIERALVEPPSTGGGAEDLRREVDRLRIKNQILAFERDHPRVRFSRRRSHLPLEAKKLCVRLFRDFREGLREGDLADPSACRFQASGAGTSLRTLAETFPSGPSAAAFIVAQVPRTSRVS